MPKRTRQLSPSTLGPHPTTLSNAAYNEAHLLLSDSGRGVRPSAATIEKLDEGAATALRRQLGSAWALSLLMGCQSGILLLPRLPDPAAQAFVQGVMGSPLLPGNTVLYIRRRSVCAATLVDLCPTSLFARLRLEGAESGRLIVVPDNQLIACEAYEEAPLAASLVGQPPDGGEYLPSDFIRLSSSGYVLARCLFLKRDRGKSNCIQHVVSGMVYNAQEGASEKFHDTTAVFPGGIVGSRVQKAMWDMRHDDAILTSLYRTFSTLSDLIGEMDAAFDLEREGMRLYDFHVLRFGSTRFDVHRDIHGDYDNVNLKKTIVVLLSDASSSMRIVDETAGGHVIRYCVGTQRVGAAVAFPSRLYHSSMKLEGVPRVSYVPHEWKIVFFYGASHCPGCKVKEDGRCGCGYD
jgi:hypothetical protein